MQMETFAVLKYKSNSFIPLEFEYDNIWKTHAFIHTFLSHVPLCFYKTLHGQSSQEL